MNLEWNPLCKPRPGKEAEFLRLFKLMRSLRAIDPQALNRGKLDRRWNEIQVPPHETLRAPRVGSDTAADQWASACYREWKDPSQTEAEFLREMQGFYVLELAPACDGLPFYSCTGNGRSELFSFNAQLLHDCVEVIGQETLQACYRTGLPRGLEALGDDMAALATQFAGKRDVTHAETASGEGMKEGSPERKVHIVMSAVRWCKYWSARGHGLAAYWQGKPV